MDKKIQIERLRHAKVFGERRLFPYLQITALEKAKTWNHKEGHCMPLSSSVFFSEAAPKLI